MRTKVEPVWMRSKIIGGRCHRCDKEIKRRSWIVWLPPNGPAFHERCWGGSTEAKKRKKNRVIDKRIKALDRARRNRMPRPADTVGQGNSQGPNRKPTRRDPRPGWEPPKVVARTFKPKETLE